MLSSIFVFLSLAGWAVGQSCTCHSTSDEFARIKDLVSTRFGDSTGSACACGVLDIVLPGKVIHPGTTDYTNETTHYYDKREDLAPKCVFVPGSAGDVALGVVALKLCKSPFAVRGGGHMPVKGAANIDGGVLVALTTFHDLTYDPSTQVLEAGPALHWYDLYSFLEPHGRVVIGGRLAGIGIAGLTLGGGINYFTNKYGFAMDNVVAYEVVTADGKIVTASATSHRDLFWALKGGAGNFGIVTKFTYQTYEIPTVSTHFALLADEAMPDFFNAINELSHFEEEGEITAAGGVFSIAYTPSSGSSLGIMLGVQAGSTLKPSYFANFSAIPSEFLIESVDNVTTLAQAVTNPVLNVPLQFARWSFGAHTSIARNTVDLVDIYNLVTKASASLVNITGFSPYVAFQPISKSAAAVATTNNIGNIWALNPCNSYIFLTLTAQWSNASDDAVVEAWVQETLEAIQAMNKAKGIAIDLIYLNDAADHQKAFDTIPKGNLQRLKEIREEYDPELVFTKLCSGGFKLD